MLDVIIIGAGVIGSSIARELSSYQLNTLVIEKEEDVCEVTSMANSAIVHSGYDPRPNTLKAKLNVLGNSLFDKLSLELGFDFKRIGSITVASNESDLETLKEMQHNGELNGVKTTILNREELLKIEPFIQDDIKYGLLAPTCGIVNPFEYCVALMENAIENGVKLHLDEEVIDIQKDNGFYTVKTTKDSYQAKMVINASGLNGERIAKMIGNTEIKIKPRKGEYFVLDHFKTPFVTHTIFPLPTSKGKGILVTPTTHGNYLLGPSSEFIENIDDYSTDKDTLDNVRLGVNKVVKNIPFNQIIRSFAGNRAVSQTNDFIIEEDQNNHNFYHVTGIQSPGLASSYAIALYVVDLIKRNNDLQKKNDFNPIRRPFVKLNNLSEEEKNKYYQLDHRFAHLICRCEKISEGEILDAIHRPCGATTVRGVKKRVRPGFGKCQGGFCESLVVKILARELHKDEKEILLGRKDSNILRFTTKEGQ